MQLGFIGLGTMGFPMCSNLLAGGHTVTVFDLRSGPVREMVAKGARAAASPAEVGAHAEFLFLSLPRPEDVESVLLGLQGALSTLSSGSHVIDLSTNTPDTVRRVAQEAQKRGVEVLDAPVSGGVALARRGTLTIMVGGSRRAFDTCYPLLRLMGRQVYHVGGAGAGNVVKLVNNYMALANLQVGLEAFVMGVKAGVDPEKLFRVIAESTGASTIMSGLVPNVLFPRTFDPAGFAIELAAKDLGLAQSLAEGLGLPAERIKLIRQAYERAAAEGLGRQDITATALLYERQAGATVEPRGPSQPAASEEPLPAPVMVNGIAAPPQVGPLGKRSIIKPLATGKNFTMVYAEYPLADRVEEHTRENDEALYMLSGEQRLEFPDHPAIGAITLTPGCALLIPAGIRHRHANTNRETMRMIAVFGPPGRETELIRSSAVVDIKRLE